jgi:hypothetical protein
LVVAARLLGQEAIKSSAAEQVAAPRAEYAIVSAVSVAYRLRGDPAAGYLRGPPAGVYDVLACSRRCARW